MLVMQIGHFSCVHCRKKNKQMRPNRKDCPMRHENGNCTVAGGFCTAVNDPICEALHNAYECGKSDFIDEYKKFMKDKQNGGK